MPDAVSEEQLECTAICCISSTLFVVVRYFHMFLLFFFFFFVTFAGNIFLNMHDAASNKYYIIMQLFTPSKVQQQYDFSCSFLCAFLQWQIVKFRNFVHVYFGM